MNNRLCRTCGCEIREFDLCTKCCLKVTTVCNCCKNIVGIQTHVHGKQNGL